MGACHTCLVARSESGQSATGDIVSADALPGELFYLGVFGVTQSPQSVQSVIGREVRPCIDLHCLEGTLGTSCHRERRARPRFKYGTQSRENIAFEINKSVDRLEENLSANWELFRNKVLPRFDRDENTKTTIPGKISIRLTAKVR